MVFQLFLAVKTTEYTHSTGGEGGEGMGSEGGIWWGVEVERWSRSCDS